MVKHVILWKLKETLNGDEKKKILNDMKKNLEGLKGKIQGLEDIKIIINPLGSSNADVMLDSVLVDAEALAGYQSHPEHVNVANTYVRPFTEIRLCMDYEV
ncbi:MAG: Dabb family protein [Clostridium sp.]|nr:Dabb family protein [Clostridium sp.]MCM1398366.1 Dabb family protein [Clostridium sp.]MCM1458969.1 Dabb family protein [Bacteroides sp.]